MDQSQHPEPTTSSLEMRPDKSRSSRGSDRAYVDACGYVPFNLRTSTKHSGNSCLSAYCKRTLVTAGSARIPAPAHRAGGYQHSLEAVSVQFML